MRIMFSKFLNATKSFDMQTLPVNLSSITADIPAETLSPVSITSGHQLFSEACGRLWGCMTALTLILSRLPHAQCLLSYSHGLHRILREKYKTSIVKLPDHQSFQICNIQGCHLKQFKVWSFAHIQYCRPGATLPCEVQICTHEDAWETKLAEIKMKAGWQNESVVLNWCQVTKNSSLAYQELSKYFLADYILNGKQLSSLNDSNLSSASIFPTQASQTKSCNSSWLVRSQGFW